MNIYIGSFSQDVTEEDLREAFAAYGQVGDVKLIKDKYSGESRGFGFVEMPSKKEAESAMDGIRTLKDSMVVVNEARPRASNSFSSGKRGSGNRGGYSRERRY